MRAAGEPSKEDRIAIAYIEPKNAEHRPLFDLLKSNQALERVRDVLSAIRWPRPLRLELSGCDGESNAFYADATVTVCYEYLQDAWASANSSKRPAGISREDAFIGPFVDVFFHETGHAVFDLLKVPVLGREEDAADQIAAYYMLQMPGGLKRRLILGAAYSYASELKVRNVRDLYRPRLEVGRHVIHSDEHGTSAQRLYNLLCIAYGSDKTTFGELVEKGYLPASRVELCEGEYQQVQYAVGTLMIPHLDAPQ